MKYTLYTPSKVELNFAQECQTHKQFWFMKQVHGNLETILNLSNDRDDGHGALLKALGQDKYEHLLQVSMDLLMQLCNAPEQLGALSEEYLRRLFNYGEQVLRLLESEIGKRYGGRKYDKEALLTPHVNPKSTQKEQRHLRRQLLRICIGNLEHAAPESVKRVQEFRDITVVALGDKYVVQVQGCGKWRLPALKLLKAEEQERWDGEMFWACMKGLQGAAVCLSFRYMRWPVQLRGQTVPGTGLFAGGTGVLKEWLAVEPEDAKEYNGDDGFLRCITS